MRAIFWGILCRRSCVCSSEEVSRRVYKEDHTLAIWSSPRRWWPRPSFRDEEVGSLCYNSCEITEDFRLKPGTGILLSGLKACSSLRDLELGHRLRRNALENKHIYVANSLANMYAKCGNMPEAFSVFHAMPRRNHASWNTLIVGYAENGESGTALEVFSRMEEPQRNALTFVAASMACASLAAQEEGRLVDGSLVKLDCLERGMEVHSCASKAGCDSELLVASSLVDMYAKCGSMANARNIFSSILHRDVVCWTSLIQGYAENGHGEEALDLFSAMSGECEPNARTFVAVLLACASLASREVGRMIADHGKASVKVRCLEIAMATHSRAAKMINCLELDVFVASSLVDAYAKCGSLVDARMAFDRMRHRDVVLWTSLLLGYVDNEECELALELFEFMVAEGCKPGAQSFVAGLVACARLAVEEEEETTQSIEVRRVKLTSLDKGMAIHSRAYTNLGCCDSNVFLGNTLVDMYSKCGSLLDARIVFDRMFHRSIASWNALIAGYAENREAELALELFSRLECAPNAVTYAAALLACTELATLEFGKAIHAAIIRCALESDELVANKLVDLYGRCGCMVDAEIIVSTLGEPTVVSWNALIAGYSRQAEASSRAFSAFQRMREEESVAPNEVTFLLVLTACSHAGLVDMGQACFDAMVSTYNLTPGIEHYHCLADIFGRANQLEKALEIVTSMPYKATSVSWKTILASCRKWRNVEAGKFAFDSLLALEVDGHKTAAFLLMASLYGSLDMWEEQAKVLEARNMLFVDSEREKFGNKE
ncbi:pentatricopeptide repeat-containing protein At2g13600-like isoform X1 [Selaginella moellendorffii]|uniref:pentatricopeptide repeat-containing protein At2g13600-like isoform X1 n=2 Tax=Selaginella moellendorffii TaxID=88036 RepID=UPI000D1C2892|nr:pentatricopeptide repeat-containing protein At2g13600-like isoform X1 [Selaginella moellendorffii]XP_024542786.1 pentatricopeptide repeat-containing protein At2g13600-like isoform X1 [Selaginella moellendorffii]|eukprot:XP_024542785.1 pentatricopeptide repeat-containing protein At2g13600-like isoform X1 [Selaginella moellendorffii]